jgi:hypothetical protein
LKKKVYFHTKSLNVHGRSLEQWPRGGLSKETKFTIRARNYKIYTAIGGRSALDLSAEVGVVHGGVTI